MALAAACGQPRIAWKVSSRVWPTITLITDTPRYLSPFSFTLLRGPERRAVVVGIGRNDSAPRPRPTVTDGSARGGAEVYQPGGWGRSPGERNTSPPPERAHHAGQRNRSRLQGRRRG